MDSLDSLLDSAVPIYMGTYTGRLPKHILDTRLEGIAIPLTQSKLDDIYKSLFEQYRPTPARQRVACANPCRECPFNTSPNRFTFDGELADRLELHAKHLGGFPCHMADGDERAFSLEEHTKVTCKGWEREGGDVAAVQRQFLGVKEKLFQRPLPLGLTDFTKDIPIGYDR